jgi:hypothetical protein
MVLHSNRLGLTEIGETPGYTRNLTRSCKCWSDVGCHSGVQSRSIRSGWEFYGDANIVEDAARVALLEAMARRLVDQLTARKRRGDGNELLSPLVMPALPIASALGGVLDAAARESGEHDDPCQGLPQVVDQLRSMADLLETMTPSEYRVTT